MVRRRIEALGCLIDALRVLAAMATRVFLATLQTTKGFYPRTVSQVQIIWGNVVAALLLKLPCEDDSGVAH